MLGKRKRQAEEIVSDIKFDVGMVVLVLFLIYLVLSDIRDLLEKDGHHA